MTTSPTIHHGRTLVHDMLDRPLHWLDEVSVAHGRKGPDGYRYLYGWTRRSDNTTWDLYVRREPYREEVR